MYFKLTDEERVRIVKRLLETGNKYDKILVHRLEREHDVNAKNRESGVVQRAMAYWEDDEVNIEPDALVSAGEGEICETGAFVLAWVWVEGWEENKS